MERAPIQARRHSTRVHNAAVERRLAAITAKDSQRASAYPIRAEAQRARFNLPAWPTTTIGSFPQTTEIRGLRLDFKKGNLDANNYLTGIAEHIKQAIVEQERLGLGMCWCTVKPSVTIWWNTLVNTSTASSLPRTAGCRATVLAA